MRRFLIPALLVGALVLPVAARAGDSNAEPTAETASAALFSGCKTVDIARTGKDIFGLTVYRFHQVKTWCWTWPRVTSTNVYTYVSNVDPNMDYSGIVSATGGYYVWCCGNGKSGHFSFRQGKFRNCILWFPCSRTEYPWVKIWAHGDGSYVSATGL